MLRATPERDHSSTTPIIRLRLPYLQEPVSDYALR